MEAASSREHDNGPRNAAILSFATVIVLLLVVYVALFDVNSAVEKIIFGVVVLGAIGAAFVVHRDSTPTGELSHPDKIRREQRHAGMLNGMIALTAVGVGIAAQTRSA